MVTLEQIRLLESKIGRAIEFVARLTEEKARLVQQNEELEEKNRAERETITALRETIETLKEEKSRVEEGIASALGKLDQFEDAIERTLKSAANDAVDTAVGGNGDNEIDYAAVDSGASFAEESPAEEDLPASAYTVDEEIEDIIEETIEEDVFEEDTQDKSGDSGEAELDIF